MGDKVELRVQISVDTMKRVKALKPIVDVFTGFSFESEDEYIEFLLNLATYKVLNDVLPDAETRLDLIKMVFKENPELVASKIMALLSEEEGSGGRREERHKYMEDLMHT